MNDARVYSSRFLAVACAVSCFAGVGLAALARPVYKSWQSSVRESKPPSCEPGEEGCLWIDGQTRQSHNPGSRSYGRTSSGYYSETVPLIEDFSPSSGVKLTTYTDPQSGKKYRVAFTGSTPTEAQLADAVVAAPSSSVVEIEE